MSKNTMNLTEYVLATPLTFEEKEFNMVDSLVLSQLSYVRFEEYDEERIRDFAKLEYFPKMFKDSIFADENKELLMAAAISPRFRDVRIRDAVSRTYEDEQFAAMVFDTGLFTYAAFRGTDGTMTGWRENFRLAYLERIPSQIDALEYLRHHKTDYVGGQSRGGNLAAYAGSQTGAPEIHCFDSPGFRHSIAEQLNGKNVKKVIAEASVIGVLLEDISDCGYVQCDTSIFHQHSPYSWKIENDHFVMADRLSPFSDYLKRVVSGWLLRLPEEDKREFVETLFEILEENGIRTVNDLKGMNLKDAKNLIGTAHSRDVKDNLKEVLGAFSKESIRIIAEGIKRN